MAELSERMLQQLLRTSYQSLLLNASSDEANALLVTCHVALAQIFSSDSIEYHNVIETAKSQATAWYVQQNEPVITDGRDLLYITGEHPVILAGAPSELVRKWGNHYDNCDDCQHARFCAVGKNIIIAMGRYLDANPYTIGAMSISQ